MEVSIVYGFFYFYKLKYKGEENGDNVIRKRKNK